MSRRIPLLGVLFLVLLRLAIGWHFLVEGVNKVLSVYRGPTVSSRPFSSVGFFREATGPLGPVFRSLIGDPDTEALDLLTVRTRAEGEDPANDRSGQRMPPLLSERWWAYVHAFDKFYGLDTQQRQEVNARVDQAQAKVVRWLEENRKTEATKKIKKSFPSGDVEREESTAERIAEYKAKVAEVQDLTARNWTFLKDVAGPNLRKTKMEAAELRSGLLADLDGQTADMQKSLENVLTAEQKQRGPMPPVDSNKTLSMLDWLTRWGLTVMGACLLIGFLSRTNCLLAGGFLLMTYLCAPSWPWLPAAPQSEGNYLFVNKNLVEMLALFALATLPTGRWFGLDALIAWIFGIKDTPPPAPGPAPART
jgi:uncharacterized membrane protein YphA (DoxX/SURF4 family)